MFVTTESGSLYEFDLAQHQCRRLFGTHVPTANQIKDGQWRTYDGVDILASCKLLIVWGWEVCEDGPILRRTITSQIMTVDEKPVDFAGLVKAFEG